MKKCAQVANFNVVFGEDERPMLDYFDSIIYPALTSGITKTLDDNVFLFKDIEISTQYVDKYVLTGKLVKKTILEIKSDLDEDGELVEKDEKYSSAPYSSFAINLLNHRMMFMPNQKGSPTLANFRTTVKYVLSEYVKNQNSQLDNEKKLEYALINVVGIPSARSMDELLDNVEKVTSLTLRFYPLNGDMDFSAAFGILTTDMRNEVGCKNGEIVFKSPKSISGIKSILEKAAGTIDPIIKVITKGKSKAILKDYELLERYDIDVDEKSSFSEETNQLVSRMGEISTLTYTNDEHNRIYERNKQKIIPFVKEKR